MNESFEVLPFGVQPAQAMEWEQEQEWEQGQEWEQEWEGEDEQEWEDERLRRPGWRCPRLPARRATAPHSPPAWRANICHGAR